MTKGRVYVLIDKNKDAPKSIIYFDKTNKRNKQIDLTHSHTIKGEPTKPHTQKEYFHNEKGDSHLTTKEKKMVDRIMDLWYNRHSE